MIIDDIYTTGSTVDGVSLALKAAGAEQVYFLTIAIGTGFC
ncbi:MAG: ComF family protein [Blautia producta]